MANLAKEQNIIGYLFRRYWLWWFNCMPNHSSFDGLRRMLLRWMGIKVEPKVKVFAPLHVSPKTRFSNIQIREGAFINAGARFSAPGDARIVIGKRSLTAPNVSFETVNHLVKYVPGKARGAVLGKIDIGEGVWIGSNVIILQNVSIGTGSVIAAGSVVTKSVPEGVVAGGIPAKTIKEIEP